jgi:hypothetical protein
VVVVVGSWSDPGASAARLFDAVRSLDAANLDVLRKVFTRPDALRLGQTREQVTQEAAAHFARLADGMRDRGLPAMEAAHFLMAASIRTRTVARSVMPNKLASYPRQNALAKTLREIGRIERTLFTLNGISDPQLRRHSHAGLKKGEARTALARAVFFNRLGELRDRTFENQRYRASGLNLVVAAIILWNTVYLSRAVDQLRAEGHDLSDELLAPIAPLGWEHVSLTGDYVWSSLQSDKRTLRPLRGTQSPIRQVG